MPPRINVTTLRERLGLNQKELAARLHTSERTVSRWETAATDPLPMAANQLQLLVEEADRLERERDQARGSMGESRPRRRPLPDSTNRTNTTTAEAPARRVFGVPSSS